MELLNKKMNFRMHIKAFMRQENREKYFEVFGYIKLNHR